MARLGVDHGGGAHATRSRLAALCLVLALIIGGCATPPDPSDPVAVAEFEEVNDPLEPLNRTIFSFNTFLDDLLITPAIIFYQTFIPPEAREGIGNFLRNLNSPVVLINSFLQGDVDQAGVTFARFLINTTLGVGGFGDPATDLGWERRSEDFGQTLAVWGSPEGPYLIIPVLGPSNPRDLSGFLVDALVFDPIGWYIRVRNDDLQGYGFARTGLIYLDARARNFDELESLRKSSLDYYAALRSLYRQFRRSQIYNGNPPLQPVGPGFGDFPEDDGFDDEVPF